jgi:putative ABC transport system permease protein
MKQDIRYALRGLVRSPGFAAVAVLTLALGIGASTSIFSVLHAVLWNPLPFAEPERLVVVWETDAHNQSFQEGFSAPDFLDFRSRTKSFSGLAAARGLWLNLTEKGSEAERISADAVSHDFFAMLGVAPALGRGFSETDDRPGAPGVALLSDGLWRSRYASSRAVLGTTIWLDGKPYSVAGVMPPGIDFPDDTQVWIPLEPALGALATMRGVHNLGVFARLGRGVSAAGAGAELSAIAADLARQYPEDNAGRGARVQSLRDAIVGDVRPALLVLLGAVALVLLISCANVAGLLLARAAGRSREIAIRRALGAGRGRLVRQLLVESLLLAAAGCAAGLALASWGTDALVALSPRALPHAAGAGLHLPVLLFSAGVSVLCGILAGLVPALGASRSLESALRAGDARLASGGRGRGLLVGGQIALACVLATGAGLLLRTFQNLHRVDPGFRAAGLLTARMQLPLSKYPEPRREDFANWPEVVRFYDALLPRLQHLPGAVSAALAVNHPMRSGWTSQVEIDGVEQPPGQHDESRIRPVSPGYFQTIGTPVLQGRALEDRDRRGAPQVVLINEAFARRYFAGKNPVGRFVKFWGTSREVVGVVRDVRFRGLSHPADPAVYPSLYQVPISDVSVVLRASGDPALLAPAVREALRSVDPDVALFAVQTGEALLAESLTPARFQSTLLTLFGAAALLLSALGLYGLLADSVVRRTREIGIRAALGARRGDLIGMIVREGLTRGVGGLAIGVGASLATSRLLSRLLYGVDPLDPGVYAAVLSTLLAAALAASLLPARRASRVDPIEALRFD